MTSRLPREIDLFISLAWLDAGCWRIHHRRWYTHYILWRWQGKYIIQQVNERTRFTILHSFKTWMISRIAREILVGSLFTCWMMQTCYLTYLHLPWHESLYTYKRYHEMLSVSTSLRDPMTDVDGISYLDWDREHIHMFTYIPQMLSVHAHLVSKRNIYYVVSISYDHYDAEHIMHIMWSR